MILPIFFAATVAASASASASASISASASASASAAPTTLPAGHPHVPVAAQHAGPNFFRPPADTTSELASIPVGTIRVELRDPFDHPLASHVVDLGIVRQSIAKGDTHLHDQATTDAAGVATFPNLEASGNIAYRVTVHDADATFAATPFRLEPDKGTQVVLHVYPVMHDLPQTTQIGTRSIVAIELKDDRIHVQQEIDFFNGTALAWVPHGVVLHLPEGFTALNGMQQMSDIGVDAVAGEGARLHGTFPPGQSSVVFSWQVPYSGDPSVTLDVGFPPAVRDAFVQAAAAPDMKLEVAGFPAAIVRTNQEDQRLLVTRKQLNDDEPPIRKVSIVLSGLPTPGPTRLIATVLAVIALVAGLYIAAQPRKPKTASKAHAKRDRERILDEIDELEVAKTTGDIGPKTYERARRELVDELAALLATSK